LPFFSPFCFWALGGGSKDIGRGGTGVPGTGSEGLFGWPDGISNIDMFVCFLLNLFRLTLMHNCNTA
jgi:hypothetical protein